MRHQLRTLIVCWCVAAASVVIGGELRPSVELTDLSGQRQRPFQQFGRDATVLFFVLPDCPISNATAPEIQRIAAESTKKNVACFIIYVDPDLSIESARKHATQFGYGESALLDTRLELVKQAGATIAPEAVVLGPDGQIQYRGRINDLYAGYGKRRAQPSQHDLRLALDAVLAGQPVIRSRVPAIGCHIAQPE